MIFAEVIVDISVAEVDKYFDYAVCDEHVVKRGCRVTVPFHGKIVEGFVINLKRSTDVAPDKIKSVLSIIDIEPIINDEMFALMDFLVEQKHFLRVEVLRLFIPAAMRGGRVKELTRQFACLADEYRRDACDDFIKPNSTAQRELFYYLLEGKPEGEFVSVLTKEYSAAALKNMAARGIIKIENFEMRRVPYLEQTQLDKHVELLDAQQAAIERITGSHGKTFVLFGVTGSGKTEVYMRCIERVLAAGKKAIMLVPEISLTAQVLRNFRARFGDSISLLHSGLSDGEKFDEWRKVKSGEASVVLGARSAIFAPIENVGIIILDEEHDSSYISESSPRYSTIDVARFRSQYNDCNLILGSATPSIETFYAAKIGKYVLLEMPERINKMPMPKIEIVNMCEELAHGNNTIFSEALAYELAGCIKRGEQAMLFLNRRGYASYVMCKKCGYVATCERCDVSLVYHHEENLLKCHYCGNKYNMLNTCPSCGFSIFKQGYIGTQKVVEQLQSMLPTSRILRMDNDTTRTKDAHARILNEFGEKKADILVGTQMIAKGHDFPNVTLVGILDSDMSLHFADYRSVERTYQLTTQVSGRAGRENKAGKVILQTYTPYHYVYKFVITGDYNSFYEKEVNLREVTKYPPFATIVRILVSGTNEEKAGSVLKEIYNSVTALKESNPEKFIYLGYMRAPLKKIMDEYRMQILIRLSDDCETIVNKVFAITEKCRQQRVNAYAEVNPVRLS